MQADVLILPFWEGGGKAFQEKVSFTPLEDLLHSGDFKGKAGDVVFLYGKGGRESRFLVLGLGKKENVSAESLRKAFASALKRIKEKNLKSAHLLFPLLAEEIAGAVLEGILLSNYAFSRLKGDASEERIPRLLETLSISSLPSKIEKALDRYRTIAQSVYFARDLVNDNADHATPEKFAKEAASWLGGKVKTTVLDCVDLEREGMGLLLAVGQGARYKPCMIQASYRGDPEAKEHILLVGKGVTYDTGGLCLKTADNMLTMKCDMAGAAAMLAAVKAVAELGLKVNVTVLAPLAENAIGSKSFKQGDVYRSFSGKTVEILNTDAEGRLILADAIAWGVKHCKPTLVIDAATLTGAIVIALGDEIAGLFSNDEALAQDLADASHSTGEHVWRLPLHDYKASLHSDIADLVNMGGREAGSMKAALFLQEFTEGVPWAHIDMAGTAFLGKPKGYSPTKATGWGVRLLVEFLARRAR